MKMFLMLVCVPAYGSDWMFRPSYYTHDASGRRVYQYAQPEPAYVPDSDTYHQWGYRDSYYRNGSDHLHVLETWGEWPHGYWPYPRPYPYPYRPW